MNNPIKRSMSYAIIVKAMGEALSRGSMFDFRSNRVTSKLLKRCLLCGAEHTHNNSFCSAQHCIEYHRQQKANKVILPNVNQQAKQDTRVNTAKTCETSTLLKR